MLDLNVKAIYLDINMWNRLCDQKVEPQHLLYELKLKSASLALSEQTVYELAKTFITCPQRARTLFEYLKLYVDAGIIGAHDCMEQLHREVSAMNTGAFIVAFYGPQEYSALKADVDNFAKGIFDEQAHSFIKDRRQFSLSTRSRQNAHFKSKQDVGERLKAVSKAQVGAWLQSEMLSDNGAALLTNHLLRMYGNLAIETAIQQAYYLLRIPPFRIVKGLVRADLYSNWRCANRDSIRRDLVDDMYHVLNSSYCSIYATADHGQVEYAGLLLSDKTQVSIYDDQTPVDIWLMDLV